MSAARYGLVIKVPSPALVEMCAAAGFNFRVHVRFPQLLSSSIF